ncbi:MAG: hypothetical protein M1308_11215 [Actinobacteria bacterium]|nr:hypothetical protein [Actinomycetota bacterium]
MIKNKKSLMLVVLPVVVLSFVFLSTSAFTTNVPDKNKNNTQQSQQQNQQQDQNKMMEAKKKELQSQFEKLKGMSKEDLEKNLKNIRQDLQNWANQNSIDLNKMDRCLRRFYLLFWILLKLICL